MLERFTLLINIIFMYKKHLAMVNEFFISFFSLLIGIILGIIVDNKFLIKKQIKRAQEQLKLAHREQIKGVLKQLGYKPTEERINRIISQAERSKVVKKNKLFKF